MTTTPRDPSTIDPSANPEPAHEHAERPFDDVLREEAMHANARDWGATFHAAEQRALVDGIQALAPIAGNREALRRVLEALEVAFVPCAHAPRKSFARVLEETLSSAVGQTLLTVAMNASAASQPPPEKPTPCPCSQKKAPQEVSGLATPHGLLLRGTRVVLSDSFLGTITRLFDNGTVEVQLDIGGTAQASAQAVRIEPAHVDPDEPEAAPEPTP